MIFRIITCSRIACSPRLLVGSWNSQEEFEEILPKSPRKITEDFPDDIDTFTEEAKL